VVGKNQKKAEQPVSPVLRREKKIPERRDVGAHGPSESRSKGSEKKRKVALGAVREKLAGKRGKKREREASRDQIL